jgi:hypothetical protein
MERSEGETPRWYWLILTGTWLAIAAGQTSREDCWLRVAR